MPAATLLNLLHRQADLILRYLLLALGLDEMAHSLMQAREIDRSSAPSERGSQLQQGRPNQLGLDDGTTLEQDKRQRLITAPTFKVERQDPDASQDLVNLLVFDGILAQCPEMV